MPRPRRKPVVPSPASSERRPTVYVVAGPNGAGKTTFATTFLPDFVQCREFLKMYSHSDGLALQLKIDAAFRAAARKVIDRARQFGTGIIIWRDDRVTEISCDEAEQLLERRTAAMATDIQGPRHATPAAK